MIKLQLETSGHGGVCIENDCASVEEAERIARVHKRGCCKHHSIELREVDTKTGEYVGAALGSW